MKMRRFLELDAPEWWLALSTAALIPAYWIAIRLGLYRPRFWPLEAARGEEPPETHDRAVRIATLVNAACRHSPLPVTCLVRSLVLISQLRRRNIGSCLRIGVRIANGKFEAHAWVEHQGVPVNDHPETGKEFAAFDSSLSYKAFAHL